MATKSEVRKAAIKLREIMQGYHKNFDNVLDDPFEGTMIKLSGDAAMQKLPRREQYELVVCSFEPPGKISNMLRSAVPDYIPVERGDETIMVPVRVLPGGIRFRFRILRAVRPG